MEEEEKAVIIELVSHLGGRYTAKMSRSNTHLIVDRAHGQKWANAAAFGVQAVTTDWLVDSAKAGKSSSLPALASVHTHDLSEILCSIFVCNSQ